MAKVVPLNGKFQNMQAFLAHIAEDSAAVGFTGAVRRVDPITGLENFNMVSFEVTVRDMAYVGSALIHEAMIADSDG